MVKAPPKPQELSRREQRALKLLERAESGGSTDSATNLLLSSVLNAPENLEATSQERGRPARRRLLPRSHKTGGRKRPILVSPGSSRSRSPFLCGAGSRRSAKNSQDFLDLDEERDCLVDGYKDRSRLVCDTVLTLSSKLDALILQQKWNRECKVLEERLRTIDAARDLVGVLEQFTTNFNKENIFKQTQPVVKAPAVVESDNNLSAAAVIELLSDLTTGVDSNAIEEHPTTLMAQDSRTIAEAVLPQGDTADSETNDKTPAPPEYTSAHATQTTETASPTEALHAIVIVVQPSVSPPLTNTQDNTPRTYYQELITAALQNAQAQSTLHPQAALTGKANPVTVLKDRVLFSHSDKRDSPVHLLEGKGCIARSTAIPGSSPRLSSPFSPTIGTPRRDSASALRSTGASSSSPRLPSPATPRTDSGSANPSPYSELPPASESVSSGHISTKRRRAIRPPVHVQGESYMYAYSHWQDQLDEEPSLDDPHSNADAGSIGTVDNVPPTDVEKPVQLSDIQLYTKESTSHPDMTAAASHINIAGIVRPPPQAHSRTPSARQRFATWSTSGFAGASNEAGPDADVLESGYADDLAQFRQRQHSTGLSLLEKVWRW